MPYIIAPLDEVKGEGQFPEFQGVLRALEAKAHARATSIWPGFSFGGLIPSSQEYGIGPLRKNDMSGDTTDSLASGSYTFRKNITATGWADIFNYTVRTDMIHSLAGFLISDDVLRITQLRLEIGKIRFPIWDIQEAQRYNKYAIVLKMDEGKELIAEPRSRMLARLYAESTGWQRVVPVGFSLFKHTDVVLTET